MTDFSDFKAQIAEYEARGDWDDTLVVGFIRQAEEYLNRDLRIDWQITSTIGTLVDRAVTLPDDWLMADLIRNQDGLPIRYKSRDEFYNSSDAQMYGYYTITGRELILGGTPDPLNGIQLFMSYYAEVPVFADDNPSWLYTKFPGMYLNAARMIAKGHAVGEEQTAQVYKMAVDEMVQKLNAQHLVSKASGSRLTRTRLRSFG
jgi:hypothetical protein